ncbi:Aldo-keto reductase family 1 member C23-like protein [Heterocephalus glaber]|uniref:Aldo-keto reductase family 1 member C23-like protein n=1 Tax=Heterocephalus glaber TaxID=10181 RepID=G5C4E2_HETGA|nr:Aldo-keto reductase family 1 member C23-like protein [Heterocephalus glaber]
MSLSKLVPDPWNAILMSARADCWISASLNTLRWLPKVHREPNNIKGGWTQGLHISGMIRFCSMAKKYKQSPSLVALRYLLQRGVVALAWSLTEKEIKENIQAMTEW